MIRTTQPSAGGEMYLASAAEVTILALQMTAR